MGGVRVGERVARGNCEEEGLNWEELVAAAEKEGAWKGERVADAVRVLRVEAEAEGRESLEGERVGERGGIKVAMGG